MNKQDAVQIIAELINGWAVLLNELNSRNIDSIRNIEQIRNKRNGLFGTTDNKLKNISVIISDYFINEAAVCAFTTSNITEEEDLRRQINFYIRILNDILDRYEMNYFNDKL